MSLFPRQARRRLHLLRWLWRRARRVQKQWTQVRRLSGGLCGFGRSFSFDSLGFHFAGVVAPAVLVPVFVVLCCLVVLCFYLRRRSSREPWCAHFIRNVNGVKCSFRTAIDLTNVIASVLSCRDSSRQIPPTSAFSHQASATPRAAGPHENWASPPGSAPASPLVGSPVSPRSLARPEQVYIDVSPPPRSAEALQRSYPVEEEEENETTPEFEASRAEALAVQAVLAETAANAGTRGALLALEAQREADSAVTREALRMLAATRAAARDPTKAKKREKSRCASRATASISPCQPFCTLFHVSSCIHSPSTSPDSSTGRGRRPPAQPPRRRRPARAEPWPQAAPLRRHSSSPRSSRTKRSGCGRSPSLTCCWSACGSSGGPARTGTRPQSSRGSSPRRLRRRSGRGFALRSSRGRPRQRERRPKPLPGERRV